MQWEGIRGTDQHYNELSKCQTRGEDLCASKTYVANKHFASPAVVTESGHILRHLIEQKTLAAGTLILDKLTGHQTRGTRVWK